MIIKDIDAILADTRRCAEKSKELLGDEMTKEVFEKDFSYRFCWASNHLEGNTLSLNETIEVIEYDEVKAGHTYTEYQEAKNLFNAIQFMGNNIAITPNWVKSINGTLLGEESSYRTNEVFIGTVIEEVYMPPKASEVANYMENFFAGVDTFVENDFANVVRKIAETHLSFERIHPFRDGNGRTGRIIFNQQLKNKGIIPISILDKSKYRQAFRIYDRNKDSSLMLKCLCDGIKNSAERILQISKKVEM
jgi:Fic family protein